MVLFFLIISVTFNVVLLCAFCYNEGHDVGKQALLKAIQEGIIQVNPQEKPVNNIDNHK